MRGVALLSTALAPVVSFVGLGDTGPAACGGAGGGIHRLHPAAPLGIHLPHPNGIEPLQHGLRLRAGGHAAGAGDELLGKVPEKVHFWATGYNLFFTCILTLLCVVLIAAGLSSSATAPSGRPGPATAASSRPPGRAPEDYSDVRSRAGAHQHRVNGLIAMAYILLTGGILNGPHAGESLTIMGFSAFGNARNILPSWRECCWADW